MSTRTRFAIPMLALLAGQAMGQSFNIEIGTANTIPSNTFGAAAAMPGTWNAVNSGTAASSTLKNLDGSNSSVTMTRTTTGSYFSNSNANLTGSYSSLLSDVQADSTLTYSFTGLTPGQYLIYTYALDAHSSINACHVIVNSAQGISNQDSGMKTPTGNQFHVGGTHALHTRIVNLGDTVTITVAPMGGGIAQLAGIQIVRTGNNGALPRFYVDDSANSDQSGHSWGNAMNDLQDAFECTRRIGGANEVWVAQGFYYPTSGADRDVSFVLPNNIKLYGGFFGTETLLSQRTSPWAAITALSGSIGGSSQSDNTRCVVDASDTNANTIIDGFSIVRGYNDSGAARGGGMNLDGSFATVRNVKFISNFAFGGGGGLSCDAGNPKIINCYFYQNDTESNGGGLYFRNNSTPLDIVNCQFIGNNSTGNGAGLATSAANVRVVNSLFTGNTTEGFGYGGGAALSGNSSFPISNYFTNCTFSKNQGVNGGGAIYMSGKSLCNITSSILWNDTAPAVGANAPEVGVSATNGSSPAFSQSTYKGASGLDGQDPMFVDADGADNTIGNTDDNLRLQPGSPCIDTGWASLLPVDTFDVDGDNNTAEQLPEDLDGNARRSDVVGIPNGVNAGSPALDRGCYELQMPFCPADMNKDGVVDLTDFFAFFNAFDQTLPAGDVDLSGEVDLSDFFTFFNYFDSSCL